MSRNASNSLELLLQSSIVVPVMVTDNVADPVLLAHALVSGGLSIPEMTPHTAQAMEVIRAFIDKVEGAITGAAFQGASIFEVA